ncbi:ABC transporter permease [Pseudonocardia halophobica]|uniref:Glutathione ABC transporter permease GsiD n=1 Tax=Pseudonocardia halophobica TaxID=29401 RepID=A0A9W6KYS1_9PSEU|nr:ABC transporter permease [Pseudonocardia halophobica]GLL10577.1 glutathione ABC transporter permease GsiD [Pseudonocardia halophobica]
MTATLSPPTIESPAPRRRGSGRLLRRFARNKWGGVAAVYLVLLVLVAIFAPLVAPMDPLAQDLNAVNQPPSAAHWLGADDVGRDILSRIIYGSRVSLIAGVSSVLLSLLVALPIGLVAGYVGGLVDTVVMRLGDALQTLPALVLALTLSAVLGPGLRNATIALAIVFLPTFLRLVRGQVIAIRKETYIEASQSIGTPGLTIMRKRILPNIASPLIVQCAVSMAFALLAEAALSFLGLGVQPPEPSWGRMLATSYTYVYSAGWQVFMPGIAIVVTVLAVTLFADALRDSLGREIRRA